MVVKLGFEDRSDVDEAVNVFEVVFEGFFEVFEGFFVVVVVLVGTAQVEMALRAGGVKLDGDQVRLDGLVNLTGSVIGVTQVVECWVMLRIQGNSFEVELNCFHIVIFSAVRITQIVEALHFLRIQFESISIVLDSSLNILFEILGIGQVIVDIGNFIVNFDDFFIVTDGLLGLSHVILGICEPDQSLNILWVVNQRLLEVLSGSLSMS
jgi:hypothetical protein